MPASGRSGEQVIVTNCSSHCGGACTLKAYVKDGVVRRIETDDGDEPQLRACLRGRSYRQRLYDPARITTPLRRVGARGEGRFEPVSWDEAIGRTAEELKRIYGAYGPESVLCLHSAGDISLIGRRPVFEVLNSLGGFYQYWGVASNEGAVFAELVTYGCVTSRNTRDDFLNSRLIIMWGWNPAVTVHDCNTTWYLKQAKERGARVIVVDPRFTDSAAALADKWVPVRPGTDTALLVALANVMISKGLHDQRFLDRYTTGFDRFRDYVMGVEDGQPKTPAWAEPVTGVPAGLIEELAVAYATTKPSALVPGLGPGRTARGEQFHRAAMTLAAMTGNIGVSGGNAAGLGWTAMGGYPFMKIERGRLMRNPRNPVDQKAPRRKTLVPGRESYERPYGGVNRCHISRAILEGKAGGYPDLKALVALNTNYPDLYLNVNRSVQALKTFEFIVAFEQCMTGAARYADIVLPTTTYFERNDMSAGEALPFWACMNKVIEPVGEAKTHLEIARLLARELGIDGIDLKPDDEDYLRDLAAANRIPDYDAFRSTGVYRLPHSEPYVAYRAQIEDPEHNPFPTTSGKIEIFSQQIADMNNPLIPPVPKYLESWEGAGDPLAEKYPLQLVTSHSKRRAHSQFDSVAWLRELEPQAVLMNASDALARGIRDGDRVRVFNDRGRMIIPARVTERIMPGVVDVSEGAWHDPDENGVDRGGCANVLTRDDPSPAGAFPSNSALVQVEISQRSKW